MTARREKSHREWLTTVQQLTLQGMKQQEAATAALLKSDGPLSVQMVTRCRKAAPGG